jgi:DNA-binding protein H-NS
MAGKRTNLDEMSTDELWSFYEVLTETLAARILEEKRALDARLQLLQQKGLPRHVSIPQNETPKKRKYPKVPQKYWNPQDHEQTWSGRGKQPRWVATLLESGLNLDDLIKPERDPNIRAA